MLEKYATEFLDYCKVIGFSSRSRQSLEISLRELAVFTDSQAVYSPAEISYGLLTDFVADFRSPSVHKKKARVCCLHQFFHFLTVTDVVRANIATGLPYPKIEKTVPHFLTAEEYNRIISFSARTQSNSRISCTVF
jgi:integrase/recombinase XerC